MYRRLMLLPFLVWVFTLQAQETPIDKCWDLFEEDKLVESEAAFTELLNTEHKAQAHYGLSLVEAALSRSGDRLFQQYYAFYQSSANPDPYLEGLWSMYGGELSKDELEYLESIVETKKGTLKAKALQALGSHYRSIGKFSKSQDYYAEVGAIGKWQLLGEFENISESGFDREHGALKNVEGHWFINKRGADVQWFELKSPRHDNWVDMSYHFYINDAIIYAQTFIESPTEQEVQFRIGTSGSLKFWANDQLLFSEPAERNNGLDTYVFTGKLNKGHNRILVQLGSSEIDQNNFLLRITDAEGENIQGLTAIASPQPYSQTSFESEVVPNKTETFFRKKIEEKPESIENYLTLAQMLLSNDKTYEAKKILLKAREHFPNSSYLLFQVIELYYRDNNRTSASIYLEELKERFPNSPLSRSLLFEEALELKDFEKCKAILAEIEKTEGRSVNVYTKKIELASAMDESETILSTVESAYSKYPDNYYFTYLKALVEKDVKGNLNFAIKLMKDHLKKHYSNGAMEELADFYFESGKGYEGLEIYQELAKNNPIAVGYFRTLSDIYFNLQNYTKSAEYLNECIRIAPYVGQYHSMLGKIYMEKGEKAKAAGYFKTALKYNPYDYDVNNSLRTAEFKPEIFSIFPATDVYELIKNAPQASAYPEDNSLILLDEVQNVVYEYGGSEEKRTVVIKVFNTSGVDDWKQYNIPVYNNQKGRVEKAEVVKASGAKLEAQRNGATLVFENLEAGDAIHLSYRLQNYYSGKLSNHFWDKFYFAYFYPIQTSRYSIYIPASKKIEYKTENFELEPTITEEEGHKLYVWEKKDSPAIKSEYYMPKLVDYGPMLHISTIPDWTFVADWYADLAYAKTKVNYEIEETVKTLFANDTALTDLEKAQKIYDYIVNNIRYSSVSFIQSGLVPQKASDVISTKQGDCKDVSTLFVAMCKAVGIDANLVLVNSKDNGRKDLALPSIDFNHCIAKTELDNQEYYLELTDDNLPFSSVYNTVDKAFVLDIPSKVGAGSNPKYLNMPTRLKNNIRRESLVSFDGENMKISRKNVKSGTKASAMRNWMENLGETTRLEEIQESVASDFPEAKVTALRFTDGLTEVNKDVLYEYDISVPSVFTEISGLKIFKVPFTDAVSNLAFMSNDKRESPLEIWDVFNAEVFEETVEIILPAGSTTDLPKSQTFTSPYLTYDLKVTGKGNKIKITRKMEILEEVVPLEDFEEFKTQCRNILKADDMRLALK